MPARGVLGAVASSRRRSLPQTLGKSTQGDTDTTNAQNRLWVSKYTLASSGTLTELHGLFMSSGSAMHVKIVVYADNAGSPAGGALIVASNDLSTSQTGSYADVSQTGLAVAIAAGTYWVGHVDNDNNGTGSNQSSAGNVAFKTVAGQFSTPPATFPASPSTGNNQTSCWAIVL